MNTETKEPKMTWEQEQAEREKTVMAQIKRMEGILKKMGFMPIKDDDRIRPWMKGKKDNLVIYMQTDTYGYKGKIHIDGCYPSNDYLYPEVPYPSINCAWSKTDDQIIKDIERRFMPDYKFRLQKVEEMVKRNNDHKKLTANALEYVTGQTFKEHDRERDQIYLDSGEQDWHGYVKAHGDSISIEISSIDKETAKRIVDILKGKIEK